MEVICRTLQKLLRGCNQRWAASSFCSCRCCGVAAADATVVFQAPRALLLLHVRADAVVGPHASRADEIELVVQAGQVHGQFQVLLVHSPVADPAAAVAQALRVLQVKGQRAASAGRAEGMRALAPARRRRWREAGRPVGLGEEGGGVGLCFIAVVVRCWRRRGSWQSQGAARRHGGKLWFLLFPLFRLLPLAAVILEFGHHERQVNVRGFFFFF